MKYYNHSDLMKKVAHMWLHQIIDITYRLFIIQFYLPDLAMVFKSKCCVVLLLDTNACMMSHIAMGFDFT